jgi:hypothetical protein
VEVELVLGLKPLPQTHRLDWTKTDIKDSQRHPSPPGVMIGCAERPSPVDAPIDFHSVPGGGKWKVVRIPVGIFSSSLEYCTVDVQEVEWSGWNHGRDWGI